MRLKDKVIVITGAAGAGINRTMPRPKPGSSAFPRRWPRRWAGARLNCIAPGLIMNPFLERIYSPEALEQSLASRMLARKGEAKNNANAALFLMSDEGSYLTGQTLCLSGGSVMIP